MLDRLNALANMDRESDRFALRDGVLTGFVNAHWHRRPELVSLLREAIGNIVHEGAGRTTLGIEIGTGSAKLYGMRWGGGDPFVDVKLELSRFEQMQDSAVEYPAQIEALAEPFLSGFGCLIPPANIDLEDPSRIRDACPNERANLLYVYGTQGPRQAQRRDVRLVPRYVRVLSAEEEASLIFATVVPPDCAAKPGTMAIEIGSGSTELMLVDRTGRLRTIAFAIGRDDAALAAIVRGIEARDIVGHAGRHLETDAASAATFVEEAAAQSPALLFINPNRDSQRFRRSVKGRRDALDVAAARGYADAADKFSPKAKILAALAEAFGFSIIHEGRKGGLKKAMASLIARGMSA
jgi:hypothetical protein